MSKFRRFRTDALAIAAILLLALLWFAPVLFPSLTGATLLPYDNLYAFEPWHSLHPEIAPHNELLSDLVLENAVWKQHIRESLAQGEAPLWNPKSFTGVPFLAAGQASTLYPLNILFYLLSPEAAYGWFTALQVAIAGICMYLFGRALRLRPLAAFFGGAVYMFSGFLIVSVVFTMFLAAVPWLPLLLAIIEVIVRKQEDKGNHSFQPIPYILAGAGVIGLVVLAGHPELIYYTLIVAGLYALVRLLVAWRVLARKTPIAGVSSADAKRTPSPFGRMARLAGWLLAMAVLGVGLGAVQLIPLVELLPLNFRAGSASLEQVRAWAWPSRQVLSFWLPNIFGNPSHHQWFDLWNRTWTPATVNALGEANRTIFWGVKNYVEGGNYLGIATWLLAAIALWRAIRDALHTRTLRRPTNGALSTSPVETPTVAIPPPLTIDNSQLTIDNYPPPPRPRPFITFFFSSLALISLLFAFGTPLYALLYYGVPGWNQLHSPFRWVFPFTLSMAMLAAVGLNALLADADRPRDRETKRQGDKETRRQGDWIGLALCILVAMVGVGALAVVTASVVAPGPFIAIGQRIVDGSDLAQMAFADGRMFWGYQSGNLFAFGVSALLAGVIAGWLVWLGARPKRASHVDWESTIARRRKQAGLLAVALIAVTVLDLYAAHGRFNPAADPKLSPLAEGGIPPAVKFIQAREAELAAAGTAVPWRFTTFNVPGEKTFNANVGMYYGWQDIRGYDSIIPKQYADFMSRIQPQDDELLYNRIAPIYAVQGGDVYARLDNPLLDLLNVKYILTEHAIPSPTWQELYRDDSIGVYENTEVMPRIFIAPEARVAAPADQPLETTNLRDIVFLESAPPDANALVRASPQVADARISRYTSNEVFVDVNLSDRGWLVLGDAYFPGWKAYIRPFGGDENVETELNIYRANGAFRAVYLPEAGQWTVRFIYSPMSAKLGLYVSFLSGMTLLFLLLYWLWGRVYRPEFDEQAVQRVAKNSLVPMSLSLFNKAIDFAFAMLYVRILGPTGTGEYYFVVAIYGFFEIISRYGLGTLLTRDVAADKNQSSRYLTNVISLRTLLWAVSIPLMALVVVGYKVIGDINPSFQAINQPEVQALALLAAGMLFANYADALSSMFFAFEKMEYPAGLTNAVALFKVALGAAVLLAGYGYVGLAAVALVMNVVQVLWLWLMLNRTLFKPQWLWDWSLQKWMLRVSGPLMINHLLATIFWRIDVWILRPLAGAAAVGLYSIGLKYLDGLNIIPSVSTLAVFPLMSRLARRESDSLLRSYIISLRLLTMLSLPIAVAVTFLARPLVAIVGGAQYLNVPGVFHIFGYNIPYMGGADLAFQVIIWSIPIGFINSVTQYVLIAVNQQHFLTRAFLIGVVFNICGNLVLIPALGYVGAALTTILSEIILLFPFYYSVRRNVGTVPWLQVVGLPAVAAAVMAAGIYALVANGTNVWIAVAAGSLVYLGGLLVTGALRGDDMNAVLRALPIGPLKRMLPVQN